MKRLVGTFNRLHLIRQVDLFTLQLFLSAVEEEQIGRAAVRENISASTATKRIQDLEAIAGIELLERNPKGVVPTAAGEIFARYVRSIFDNIEGIRSEISAFSEGVQGRITIASARSIIIPYLARELGVYARDFPMAELSVTETDNARIINLVSRGDADIGVFAMAHELDLSGVDVTPYRRDKLVVVVPRTHPLSTEKKVRFRDIPTAEVIALDALTGAFNAASKRLGDEFIPHLNVRSAGVALSLVQAELGVTILPECQISRDMVDTLTSVELAEPWATRSVHIATVRNRNLSPAAEALMQQLLHRARDD